MYSGMCVWEGGASGNVYVLDDGAVSSGPLVRVLASHAPSSAPLCEPQGEMMSGYQSDAGPSASSDTRKPRTLATARKKKRQVKEGGRGARTCSTTRTVGGTRSTNNKDERLSEVELTSDGEDERPTPKKI